MRNNVVAPSVGESITEVSILKWAKNHGDAVKPGDLLLEIESDKATVEIVAEHPGTLQIVKQAGERIPIGEVIGFIDDSIAANAGAPATAMPPLPGAPKAPPAMPPIPGAAPTMAPPSAPPSTPPGAPPSFAPPPVPSAPPSMAASAAAMAPPPAPANPPSYGGSTAPGLSPAVRRAAASTGVNPATIAGTGKDGRVTKGDVLGATPSAPSASFGTVAAGSPTYAPPTPSAQAPTQAPAPAAPTMKLPATDKPGDRRVPMSMLRSKIAERLVQAQHTAAILTTFNEVDMSAVMKLRSEQKDAFKAKNGVNLSFMSFFTKASIAALKAIPEVNATIDGRDTVYHDYYDVGIAVGTERGLVVPVIRGADKMSFVELEKKIAEFAIKGRDGKLTMADLTGGTFTISNGGTYGSLMSTPILNPPQSGILGMHKIMDRPIAVNGKVEIRPMMYVALSYDHRLIDGKGAVTWLVTLKDHLENPEKLGFSLN